MGNFGMKVLLHDKYPNADVKTALPKELAWSSQYRHLMIYKMGTATAVGQTIPNELGYRTGVAHYLKKDNKYIEGTSGGASLTGFENPQNGAGKFMSRANQYLVGNMGNVALPYPMKYICYANALDPTEFGNYLDGTKDVGMKMGSDEYGIHVPEGQIRLSSKFRPVQIIAAGTVTVTLPARSVDMNAEDNGQTAFTDVLHGRGQANHIILSREMTGHWWAWPAPTGVSPGMVMAGYEIFVDETRIRFRISRTVVTYGSGGPSFPPMQLPAESRSFTYYLTNIPLPA